MSAIEQTRRSFINRKRKNILLLLFILFGIVIIFSIIFGVREGNEDSRNPPVRRELAALLSSNEQIPYSVDTIQIDVFDNNTCQITYSIPLFKSDSNYSTKKAVIPILTSSSAVSLLSYPRVNNDFMPIVIDAKSKSGNFFYFACFPASVITSHDSIQPLRNQVAIKFLVASEDLAASGFRLPLGNIGSYTSLIVATDWKHELKETKVTAIKTEFRDNTKLLEFPSEIRPLHRTYSLTGKFGSNDLINFNPSLITKPGFLQRQSIEISLSLIFLIILMALLLFRKELTRMIRKRPYMHERSVETLTYDIEKDLINNAQNPEQERMERIKNKIDLLDHLHSFQKNSTTYKTITVAIKILAISLVALLLLLAKASAQTPIIDKMQIELYPTFTANSKLDLRANLKLSIQSTSTPGEELTVGIKFKSQGKFTKLKEIDKANQPGVTVTATPFFYGYNIALKTRLAKTSSVPKMNMSQKNSKDFEIDERNPANKASNESDVELTLPFELYDYTDISKGHWGLSRFPYDSRVISFSLSFDQHATMDNLLVDNIEKFISDNPKIEFYLDSIAYPIVEKYDNTKVYTTKIGSTLTVIVEMKRSKLLTIFFPILLFIVSIISGISIARPKNGLQRLIVGLGFVVGIPALYKLIAQTFLTSVPDFLDFNGQGNYADVMFVLAAFVAGVTCYLSRK